jgi:hypothetical protein
LHKIGDTPAVALHLNRRLRSDVRHSHRRDSSARTARRIELNRVAAELESVHPGRRGERSHVAEAEAVPREGTERVRGKNVAPDINGEIPADPAVMPYVALRMGEDVMVKLRRSGGRF